MGTRSMSQQEKDIISLLRSCAKQKNLYRANRLHAHILKCGSLADSIFIGNSLVSMYAECGALPKARLVFNNLPVRDVVSWTALLTGYVQHGQGKKAVSCFERMKDEGLVPDVVTFSCILKACGSIGPDAGCKGREIHADIVTKGLLGNNTAVGNALVDMYAKCGALARAKQVLSELSSRDVVSWTALITGYCQQEQAEEALNCFEQMKDEGLSPNAVTLACILRVCGSIGVPERGIEIHAEIVRKGLLGEDTVLGNAIVDMYAKCGALSNAQEVFDELSTKDVVSWNVLVAGYAQHGHGKEALNCFEDMNHNGFSPDAATFVCILTVCGSSSAAEKGREIHAEVVRKRLRGNTTLGNALVDMYAKCGALANAQQAFEDLVVRDVVSWTSLIAGYSEHGHGEEALGCFINMKKEGVSPNAVTFACILKACGSIGAAEKGQSYFEAMAASYGVVPTLEHHACMTALLGYAGQFDKAVAVIKNMRASDHLFAWCALLGACSKCGNVKVGRLAFSRVVQLDQTSTFAYVCLGKICAAAGVQKDEDEAMTEAWKTLSAS